ncbi:MAG: 1-(5-phosphoribosyl)-5-[(5-phosphoribosylamino)methylideneamino]imidazole-4-carboxamide isomerase [Candidatus Binataceae bacterium]
MIPAIDLKQGRVVRLFQGDMNRATVYGDDPAAVARSFEDAGARMIHVVDLDGAVAGEPRNLDCVRRIRATTGCAIDVSGGLRTIEAIGEVLASGADRVALGSAAFLDQPLLFEACQRFPRRIFGSLDVRDGRLAIKGWVETSPLSIDEAAALFRRAGVTAIIYTDIARDGTTVGVDCDKHARLAHAVGVPVIASGGVATLDDIRNLRARFSDGVVGAITGRALYEGRFTLAEALDAAR